MFDAPRSPWLVPFDGAFAAREAATAPPSDAPGAKGAKRRLRRRTRALYGLQRRLYAQDRWAVLLVFQALDAGGKDSTIRHVLTGVNPAGCQVVSFKQPSTEELDHDFLWRAAKALPQRGRIGVFNRSHYEEVLVVRVHPEHLDRQRLPHRPEGEAIWKERLASIRDFEAHLARNGTAIVKFWLNVSKEEQRRRFLRRLERPEKHWKFSAADVEEREHFDAYLDAYEAALRATSRPWAPWYAIPADDKPYMRYQVADLVCRAVRSLEPAYPTADPGARAVHEAMRSRLAPGDG